MEQFNYKLYLLLYPDLTEHGIHLCLGSSTTFSNTLHDCLSVKSVSISPNCLPYRDFISNNYTKKPKINFALINNCLSEFWKLFKRF